MDEFRMRLALEEIVRIHADPDGRHDSAWLAALAAAALGAPAPREAEAHLARLAKDTPISVRVEAPPADGIGHLTITMTYNSIDRETWVSDGRGIRVYPGPIFPKRTFLRGYVQKDLDEMLDRIEQCEASDRVD
ncbi:MAG TPA: hypothetical protein VGG99_09935 [Acetobacteraceae bacterium]|jgi:hypothetical protein